MQVYDKYNFLITKQAEADIEDFLNGEHTFKEYCREVKKYKKLFEDITYKSRKVQYIYKQKHVPHVPLSLW